MGFVGSSTAKVDVEEEAPVDLRGGRPGGALVVVGVRDWPEWRVSGDCVLREMGAEEVSATTRGFGVGTGAGARVSVEVVLGEGLDLLETVFQGAASLEDLSHAILTGGARAAFAACSA